MPYTSELTDKIIIFIACFCVLLAQPVFELSVIPIITTVIISSMLSYIEKKEAKAVLFISYVTLCFFLPSIIVFIPLFSYDLFKTKYQLLIFVLILPIISSFEKNNLMLSGIIIIISFLALWLKKQTVVIDTLKKQYNKLTDDATEMSDKLKKQNKELYEKIDDDINYATLKERNRIAREIHDHVGHLLSSAILQIGALLATNQDDKLNEPLKNINNILSLAMTSIRESVHDLHDKSFDLHMQIEELLMSFNFCEVNFVDQLSTQPNKKLKLAFIAIIKEALSNVMRHSNATIVEIILREHPAFYQLIIKDNGSDKVINFDNGMGLNNMSERINSLNGNINFHTEHGFEIFISVPKEGVN